MSSPDAPAAIGERHRVVTIGSGGFSMEPENPPLDRFVLSLARSPVLEDPRS